MGIYIIARKSLPARRPRIVRLEPPKGKKAPDLIIPTGLIDRSELREILAEQNEKLGLSHSEDDVSAQVEQRIKGEYKKLPRLEDLRKRGR